MGVQSLYPALQITDACNKNCNACLRLPHSGTYNLRFDDVLAYQRDLRVLSSRYRIAYQFVTGGEPTIWRDRDKDVVDILGALDDLGFVGLLTMPTNGKALEDKGAAAALLRRISERTTTGVVVGISIAEYQNNLDENGSAALDNTLDLCKDPQIKIFPMALVTLSNDDSTSDRLRRLYPRLLQRVTALAPLGGGADHAQACPSLSLSGNDKSSLGSFLPHFQSDVMGKLRLTEDAFDEMPNAEVLDQLSLFCNCGRSPFITEKWHYCLPFKDDPEYDLCSLGQMREDTLGNFIQERPLLQDIRQYGVISTVRKYQDRLSSEMLEKLENEFGRHTQVSVAYRGCMICKRLKDLGVWGHIEKGISPRPSTMA